ncbi:NRDE family protein [Thiocystis violacea]|uniref:NRDE family protein n=1 Tax=Thiocystis violacea TaxID=13725 RepID=UPI0019078758|nr:NRDE family protein [Thiocystis violacea]MBK1719287.1 hypothetical protein [Thiocystis violacea]
MCTLVILVRPGHDWPVLIAANRDEMAARASRPPARHWPDRPEVVAGLDLEGGGAWLGINDHALLAAVMNREGSLGRRPGKRSRGELVLEALDHAEASEAAHALAELRPDAYRPFNLVVADPRAAYWIRHHGSGGIQVAPIPPGLHLLAGTDLDDPDHPRVATYRPRFQTASVPEPERDDWSDWRALLASREYPEALGPEAAMLQDRPDGFRTRSSALIALPAFPGFRGQPVWRHAECGPDPETFQTVL